MLVPAFLTAAGMELEEPSLAVSAVLHLGTLLAILVYFRADIARLLRFRTDPAGRHLWMLLVIGTLPALVGLVLEGPLERLQDDPRKVGIALLGTAALLLVGSRLKPGTRRLDQAGPLDAFVIGLFQALALIPGVSRSGSTIVAGSGRGLTPLEAARYSFLLGLPAIAGGGLLSLIRISDSGAVDGSLLVGLVVAAISGYAAISVLLAALRRVGLLPFALYAAVVGTAAIVLL